MGSTLLRSPAGQAGDVGAERLMAIRVGLGPGQSMHLGG